MSTKTRLISENFDRKKGLNKIQLKNLKQQPKYESKIPLDSGVVARLPTFEIPIERKGPFDIGLVQTWIIYIILMILALVALIGLILTILGLTIDIFSVAYTKNQEIKIFGVVLTSTVLTSSTILLFCFGCQHAKEVGWLSNAHYATDYVESEFIDEAAKISALYSIDPKLQSEEAKPISPSQVQPTQISNQPTIPDAEQKTYNPTYFGKLDQNISIIPHHRIPIYQPNFVPSKQTLPKIKRAVSLQIKPNDKLNSQIRLSYAAPQTQSLVINPTSTLPPIVSPSIISARTTPVYVSSTQLMRPTFNYIQPYHNNLTLPSEPATNRRETPTLPNINNPVQQSVQPSFQPYQKFVTLPNFYETPRAFIPAESQSSFLQSNSQQKFTSQSQFFPPLATQTLPIPSYGMTIQSPYYQAYPSVQYITDKSASYPNIKTVIVQPTTKPKFLYERIDPRFKRYKFD